MGRLAGYLPGRIARRFHAAVRVTKHAIAPERSASIETQSAGYAHVYPFFVGRETERFVSVACDTRYKVIATEVIAEGLPDAVDVRIADIFALAIRHRAVALLVAHNHPSGPQRLRKVTRVCSPEVTRTWILNFGSRRSTKSASSGCGY